ncbi:MAG: NAD(P)/FAD-dependent oxidoreductase [Porticoccaceae bacterium]
MRIDIERKKIAIIGAGISGLTAAYKLAQNHEVHVFEAGAKVGGHTATKQVRLAGRDYQIDTGFIVFNNWTYPNFIQLMDELGVASKPTSMGFSLSCRQTGLEYSGSGLGGLFAQRRNLLSLSHWRMLRDIIRFNREAAEHLELNVISDSVQLGDYLERHNYSDEFRRYYLIPMASAIWSSGLGEVEQMPVRFFVRFFMNHGLLNIKNRPQWRVIEGGSSSYIEPLTRSFSDQIRLNCPATSIRREKGAVLIDSAIASGEYFDEVVLACHSNQALEILTDSSAEEQNLLSAIPYTENEVVLHWDENLLPENRRTWSSWNYLLGEQQGQAVLTYNMNILQGIDSDSTFCVTLNATRSIDPDKIWGTYRYSHPEFRPEGIRAQQRLKELNGSDHTWFCGAWCGHGFHEDGVVSALSVVDGINQGVLGV